MHRKLLRWFILPALSSILVEIYILLESMPPYFWLPEFLFGAWLMLMLVATILNLGLFGLTKLHARILARRKKIHEL